MTINGRWFHYPSFREIQDPEVRFGLDYAVAVNGVQL